VFFKGFLISFVFINLYVKSAKDINNCYYFFSLNKNISKFIFLFLILNMDELSSFTLKDLKEIAKRENIPINGLRKSEILDVLNLSLKSTELEKEKLNKKMNLNDYENLLEVLPKIRKKPNYIFAAQMYLISHNLLPQGVFHGKAHGCYENKVCRENKEENAYFSNFRSFVKDPLEMNGCLENDTCKQNIQNFILKNNINLKINNKSISSVNSKPLSYFCFDGKEIYFSEGLDNIWWFSNLVPVSTYNSDTYIIEGKYNNSKSKEVYIGTFKFKKLLNPESYISKIEKELNSLGFINIKIEKVSEKLQKLIKIGKNVIVNP
jgi:hypothetical protein